MAWNTFWANYYFFFWCDELRTNIRIVLINFLKGHRRWWGDQRRSSEGDEIHWECHQWGNEEVFQIWWEVTVTGCFLFFNAIFSSGIQRTCTRDYKIPDSDFTIPKDLLCTILPRWNLFQTTISLLDAQGGRLLCQPRQVRPWQL